MKRGSHSGGPESHPVFTTSTRTHTIKFAGLNPLGGGDHTAFIDNVRITGAPKPGYGVQWLITDQLGIPRMILDETGCLANVRRHDYLPFGEEVSTLGLRTPTLGYSAAEGVRQQFTSKERDVETGLDFIGARYYSSILGRYTSADAVGNDTNPQNPQTWNRYTYVYNNPLKLIDPNGEEAKVTITTDKDSKTGTVVIEASFALYTVEGNNGPANGLTAEANEFKTQLEAVFSGTFRAGWL